MARTLSVSAMERGTDGKSPARSIPDDDPNFEREVSGI